MSSAYICSARRTMCRRHRPRLPDDDRNWRINFGLLHQQTDAMPTRATIRMYRLNELGDCFLVTFDAGRRRAGC